MSAYDALRRREAELDDQLPVLAALAGEARWWGSTAVPGPCPWVGLYRSALLEWNDVQAELVRLGAFLVA